jgi:hypothetical protein
MEMDGGHPDEQAGTGETEHQGGEINGSSPVAELRTSR